MFNKNPTIIINGLSEVIRQILPLLVILDILHLPEQQLAALISIVGIILAFISTTILRSQVTSEEQVKQLVKEAVNSPKGTSLEEVRERVEEKNV